MSASYFDPESQPAAWHRRDFVTSIAAALGAVAISGGILSAYAASPGMRSAPMTVQQIIDLILKSIPGAPFKETVDTIKSGSATQQVTGIITTMFATDAVITEAIKNKANFIIAHEPTFYNHLDETKWLTSDPVYQYKKNLLEKNGIVVWRFHDYIHSHLPDGIRQGVLEAMGWQKNSSSAKPELLDLPATTLGNIVQQLKKNLGIHTIRIVGDPKQSCKRIAILPGMAGGQSQIGLLRDEKPDLLICGEVNEWETSEYVRDARFQGLNMSLAVVGHAQSEEPGLKWLVEWLQPQIPDVPMTHIPSGDPFIYL